jgi:hypothetical protein
MATTYWYVYTTDAATNRIISDNLHKDENAEEKVLCKDGQSRPMWLVEHSLVTRLIRNREQLKLKFSLYTKSGLAPARPWLFENSGKPKSKKPKRPADAETA